jgi:hypothetical protein
MNQLRLFQVAIPVLSEAEREAMVKAIPQTYQDISSEWLESAGHGGYSAKMFLHQMMLTLRPHWSCSDTDRLLSGQTPLRLQVNNESEILLSHQIKKPGKAHSGSYVNFKAIQVIIRRAVRRGRSFRVLLRTDNDTIPVIVTFTTEDCESWTLKSDSDLPACLKDGLMGVLKAAWQE